MIRVGVFGAGGRMGRTVCEAVVRDPELELVSAVDPHHGGIDVRQVIGLTEVELTIARSAEAMTAAEVDVAVDFTELSAARENLAWLAENGIHAVVGTSGFDTADLAALEAAFTDSNCLIAPNFAVSAVLMMRFAEMAAPYFDTVEVIEMHHEGKVDAPSGTALATVERIAASSGEWADDQTESEVVVGARGGRGPGGIVIHSVRLSGLVAHQEVLFGAEGQTLTIRQDSVDRSSYMPGVVLAVKAIADHPGITFGLDAFLD